MNNFCHRLTENEICLFDLEEVANLNNQLENNYLFVFVDSSLYLQKLKRSISSLMGVSLFRLNELGADHAHIDKNIFNSFTSRRSAINFTFGACQTEWWTANNPYVVKSSDRHAQRNFLLNDNELMYSEILRNPTLINVDIPHRGYMATAEKTTIVSFGFTSEYRDMITELEMFGTSPSNKG